MKRVWKTLMIMGYVLAGLFSINLLYVLVLYGIRHDGWFFIYNPNFGPHSNATLAWQIIWSVILLLIASAVVGLSKRKVKQRPS